MAEEAEEAPALTRTNNSKKKPPLTGLNAVAASLQQGAAARVKARSRFQS